MKARQAARSGPSRESVRQLLLDLVDRGEIGHADPLSERALAERLGVSRTPVREALQELARDGVLTVHPARGAFLRVIGFEELRDLYEVRLPLEGVAAYRAATVGAHDGLVDFVDSFGRLMREPVTPDMLRCAQEVGDGFHLAMVEAAGNSYLIELYERLRLKIRISLRMTRERCPERVVRTIVEHAAVLDAILARDPERAQREIDTHLRNGFEARVRLFATLPRLAPGAREVTVFPEPAKESVAFIHSDSEEN